MKRHRTTTDVAPVGVQKNHRVKGFAVAQFLKDRVNWPILKLISFHYASMTTALSFHCQHISTRLVPDIFMAVTPPIMVASCARYTHRSCADER